MKKNQKTFAQRAAEIERKFKDRNDSVSLRTKKALMKDLRDEQEAVKAAMEAEQANKFAEGGLTSILDQTGLEAQGLNALSGAANTSGEALGAVGVKEAGAMKIPGAGMPGLGVASDALSLVGDGMKAFGKSNVDTSGNFRPDREATKKANTAGLITGLAGAGADVATGNIPGAAIKVLKTGLGAIAGGKQLKAENEAAMNHDLKLSAGYRPSNYNVSAYGGKLNIFADGGETDPTLPITELGGPRPKWRPMPTDVDPIEQNIKREAWAKQQRMNAGELGAFEDQRGNIQDTSTNRDNYLSLGMQQWRRGSTGPTPHSKYSIGSDEYTNAKNKLIQESYQMFPRTVNQGVQDYAVKRSQMAYGGKVNKYAGPYGPSLIKKEGATWDDLQLGNPSFGGQDYSLESPNIMESARKLATTQQGPSALNKTGPVWDELEFGKPNLGDKLKKGAKWLGKNSGNIAQYANVLGPLTNKIERAATPRGSRHIGKTTLGRIDEESLANKLRGSVNVGGAASETSGGSLSAYRSGAQLGNKQLLEAISDANMKAKGVNLQQGNAEEQMKMQKDSQNLQLDDRWQERSAQDEGAYQSAKQANRAAIFENISNIGREEVDKKIVKEMYGYKWNGKYYVDPNGKKVSDDEFSKAMQKAKEQMSAMFGGYLKK